MSRVTSELSLKNMMLWIICSILLVGSAFAEGISSKESRDKEVEYYDFDLRIEKSDDGSIQVTWNDFEKDLDFQWYKLLHSTNNSNPVYPDQSAVFVGNQDQTSTSLWLKKWKTNYVRICAITLEEEYRNGRYCSETQKFYIADTNTDDKKYETKDIKTHYEKKEVKAVSVKKQTEAQKVEVKKTASSELSGSIQERIDVLLADFVKRLEAKKLSDTDMIATIDRVIAKLEGYMDNARYKRIVSYMIEVLEEYRSKYDDLDIFENILNDF